MDETRGDENDVIHKVNDIPHLRRSARPRKQRIDINPEEIGDGNDENDPDYK